MLEPNLFNQIFVYPILNLLVFLYKAFLLVKIPGAFGFAILSLTLIIRFILNPLFKSQIETAKKLSQIKPHLDHLSKKHKNDRKKLQEEQLKLYQQHGINPASGCLFMIIQFPVFIALYQTLSLFLFNGKNSHVIDAINKALYHPILKINTVDLWFFGFNLAQSPQKSGQMIYLLIPLITALFQYFQTHYSLASQPTVTAKTENEKQTQNDKKDNDLKKAVDKDKVTAADDFQKAMNTQMKFIFPLMIGWFSYTLPVGLSLYWNIFSLLSIIQYRNLKVKS